MNRSNLLLLMMIYHGKKAQQISENIWFFANKVNHMKGVIDCLGFRFKEIMLFTKKEHQHMHPPKVFFTGDMDRADEPAVEELVKEKCVIFHDMGWTGIPVSERKFHPTEDEVFEKYGENDLIIGIHTERNITKFKQVTAGSTFIF